MTAFDTFKIKKKKLRDFFVFIISKSLKMRSKCTYVSYKRNGEFYINFIENEKSYFDSFNLILIYWQVAVIEQLYSSHRLVTIKI